MKKTKVTRILVMVFSMVILISGTFNAMSTIVYADTEVSEPEVQETVLEEQTTETIPAETPIVEAPAEPVAEPVVEPSAEPVAAPVVEPSAEPTVDSLVEEPVSEENAETETSDAAEEKTEETEESEETEEKEETEEEEEKEEEEKEKEEENKEDSKYTELYGEATGKEGIANVNGNVLYKEYAKDGVYTLVFTVKDPSLYGEDCAINVQFRYSEFASRTNRIVLEEGITGIGWTYLYDRGNYKPQYPSNYVIDSSKTDLFKNFQALTEVIPCSTLQRIGWSAFNGCKKLSSFNFAVCYNLIEIMNQAFNNCTSLNYVNLSNSYNLSLLAWSCFMGAGKGKDAVIYLPANENLVIGGQALNGWKNIQYAALPEEAKTMTVRFQVKEAQAITGSTLYGSLPNVVGNTEIADLTAEDVVTASDLDYAYYRTIKGTISAHFPFFTYEFKGWTKEDGTIVRPGEEFSPVDKNNDGYADLVTSWSYTWKKNSGSTGTPSVNFNVWTDTSTADKTIGQNVMLNETVSNYSPKLGAAIMYALDENGNHVYSDELLSPSTGGTDKFLMITYLDSTIEASDAAVRQLAQTGYHTSDPRNGEVTWKLSYFPEDPEVLSSLAEMVRNGLTELKDENGQVIPAEDLTTENFTVYWCHVKYQSGSTDGWNINGMLIRKTTDEDPGTGVVTPDDPDDPENPDDPVDPDDPKDPEEDDDLETPPAPTDATLPVEPFKIILVIGIAIAGIIFIGRKQKEQ